MNKYIAFLRGINVGGHHKVPMKDLKKVMKTEGYEDIITLLNSGNVIFHSSSEDLDVLEENLSNLLEKTFGFPIPTIIRKAETIQSLYDQKPFSGIEIHKDIRLYISFLKSNVESNLTLPYISPDKAYHILTKEDKDILSVLDVSISKTTKAMDILEKSYGKQITTRNWNTIDRVFKKINTIS